MSEKCISGRHNFQHLGTSCDDVDAQIRRAGEIALRPGTSIVTSTGPSAVWDENGDPVLDLVNPDGIDPSGADVYRSGHLGPARGDDTTQGEA